ncbi:MAG: carbohydrate binding family 9 domain-containing protein, partial [Bacteroidota bacterium]
MKTLLFASLCFASLFLNAQKKLEIQFLEQSISVDGKLDETVWASLPGYSNFYNYLPTDKGLAQNQTEFKLFHNGEFLFVSAVYQDTTSTVQLSSLKRDDIGNTVAESETFVFIMDTQLQQQSAYYFAVNMGGAQVDGLVERINDGFSLSSNWNTVWKAATSVDGTRKQYELAIPLKNLSFNQNNNAIALQVYVRDIKNNSWTIFTDL